MGTVFAVLLVLATGAALTFGATRATASVQDGSRFVRWMLIVFGAYLVLITLPIVFGL